MPAPRIIRFSELPRTAWRNGGGTTVEIARGPEPEGAHWGWRLSLADVERAGDFSSFEGMDRILTVVEGELLVLTVGGREQGLERFRPFRFDGGAPASAVLPTGSIRDLGLITRRGAFTGHVTILELSKKRAHPLFPGQLGVLLQGDATLDGGEPLGRYDTVVGSEEHPAILGRGFLAVVSVDAAESGTEGRGADDGAASSPA